MGNLGAFIESQFGAADHDYFFWYDYLNPTHIRVHRVAMRFVQGIT